MGFHISLRAGIAEYLFDAIPDEHDGHEHAADGDDIWCGVIHCSFPRVSFWVRPWCPIRTLLAQFPKASRLMIAQHDLLCYATPHSLAVQPAERLGRAQG